MPLPRIVCSATALCLSLLVTATVNADPIWVTSGNLRIAYAAQEFKNLNFNLNGDDGFNASGQIGDGFGSSISIRCSIVPCQAGTSIGLSGRVSPAGALGSLTIGGTRYGTQYVGASLDFEAGQILVPFGTGETLFAQTAFTFSGLLQVFAFGPSGRFPLADLQLLGQGTATGHFSLREDGYRLGRIDYEFAPTPEPGSLILLATGAAIAIRRRLGASSHGR